MSKVVRDAFLFMSCFANSVVTHYCFWEIAASTFSTSIPVMFGKLDLSLSVFNLGATHVG